MSAKKSQTLVDVVNFNADASCLSSKNWLEFVKGGEKSILYRWLELYVHLNKKIVLGFPGATTADIVKFNPQAIDLINSNPQIFELILRPFSHDISLLRTCEGFKFNMQLGIQTTTQEFRNVFPFYLPPEFMCNSTQISLLANSKVKGIFINSGRFDIDIGKRIPKVPYKVRGLLGTELTCIPFHEPWTLAYFNSIHKFSATPWNSCLSESHESVIYVWRDGESAFLLPDTVKREEAWLSQEAPYIERKQLNELSLSPAEYEPFQSGGYLCTYPIHSFSAWIREMKMYWYVYKVQKLEEKLLELSNEKQALWLHIINSDILSAVEKRSPTIQLIRNSGSSQLLDYTIFRKEKEFEGEEFFEILENINSFETKEYYLKSNAPHIIKLRSRLNYLLPLIGKNQNKWNT